MIPEKTVPSNTSTNGFCPRTNRSSGQLTISTRQNIPRNRNFKRFNGTSCQYERWLVPPIKDRIF
jgi:hypothetical protein